MHERERLLYSHATAKLPKPKEEQDVETKVEDETPLPQTLVRIPTQHAPAVIEQANAGTKGD